MNINESIIIKDAYENNLKHIDVEFPLNTFTCVTGCSGGGKSSLVFDTIYAESQRLILESMSGNLYVQKFMNKPKVGYIKNLRPALNLSQTYYNVNPRSTVGSVSEISFYLRGIFALLSSSKEKKFTEKSFSSYAIESCCPKCLGTGEEFCISEELLIPDRTKKLKDGAILYYKGSDKSFEFRSLVALCEHFNINIEKRIDELSESELHNLLYFKDPFKVRLRFKSNGVMKTQVVLLKGAIIKLHEKMEAALQNGNLNGVSKYVIKKNCSFCDGLKLKPEILQIKLLGVNISELENLSLNKLLDWMNQLEINFANSALFLFLKPLIEQIKTKVGLLFDLKLGYLSLSRSIPSLSGGEKQRLRFANQLGCPLKDLIYILDEPCKGLHYKDVKNLVRATKDLITKGNTVISIEHNKQFLIEADKIIELGPKGGQEGGYIIEPHTNFKVSLTYKSPKKFSNYIELKGINFRSIKNQNVKFPINGITCISGVSGSGKSSLVTVISECLNKNTNIHCHYYFLDKPINKIMEVNQNPIGKNPRSTILSYLDLSEDIRKLFATTSDAKKKKIPAPYFSTNVTGGRCECCQGTGVQKIDMNYLQSAFVICPECCGKRFNEEILSITYKNKNINQILDEPISEIISVFYNNQNIYSVLDCLIKLGLGYLSLGQMSMNLSGGEAQRIKLAKALGCYSNGNCLFILDEPTSGLNAKDIEKFKLVLNELQNKGNTILIVEHNIEFISSIADYLVDFGNAGGDEGGKIVSTGTVEEVINDKKSSWYGILDEI